VRSLSPACRRRKKSIPPSWAKLASCCKDEDRPLNGGHENDPETKTVRVGTSREEADGVEEDEEEVDDLSSGQDPVKKSVSLT
jgi:hypothetical protein